MYYNNYINFWQCQFQCRSSCQGDSMTSLTTLACYMGWLQINLLKFHVHTATDSNKHCTLTVTLITPV